MIGDSTQFDGFTRLICLDVGDRRIGVAASDPTGLLATPVEIYQRRDVEQDVQHVVDLVSEYDGREVVVGLPKNMNGSEGPQAEKTRDFADALTARGLPVVFWDERLSSVEVERQMDRRSRRRGVRRWIDDRAAAVILQTYLDHLRMRAPR